jgi:CheY-like chemotaxis protein
VEYADDGVEALEKYVLGLFNKKPFDVVIMDLTVPGQMGGKEAVQRLLAMDPKAKVIVTSGYANDPVMEDYISQGFCGVITKPCNLAKLSQLLDDVLKA